MLKLLIAADGSDHAGRAMHAAARLRQELPGLSAVLLNVRAPTPLYGDLPPPYPDQIERRLEAEQAALLEAALTHARLAGLDAVSTRSAVGDPAEEIVRVAGQEQADFIVMGTRGLGRLGGLLIGSVAQRVLHLARVPVIVVK